MVRGRRRRGRVEMLTRPISGVDVASVIVKTMPIDTRLAGASATTRVAIVASVTVDTRAQPGALLPSGDAQTIAPVPAPHRVLALDALAVRRLSATAPATPVLGGSRRSRGRSTASAAELAPIASRRALASSFEREACRRTTPTALRDPGAFGRSGSPTWCAGSSSATADATRMVRIRHRQRLTRPRRRARYPSRMRLSKLFFTSLRDDPADAEMPSHRLLLRAGYVRQLGSGIYSLLPLGFRVNKRVEQVIREEMDRIGSQEIEMPVVHPADIWKASGRYQAIGPEPAGSRIATGARWSSR